MKNKRNVKERTLSTLVQSIIGNALTAAMAGITTGNYSLAGWLALGAALTTAGSWVKNQAQNRNPERATAPMEG